MFAPPVGAPYDFGAVRIAFALVLVVGCASPMSAIKDDNRRLSQTVTELRADRRAQERRMRDLQRQLDLVRAQVAIGAAAGAPPDLRVEVAAPPAPPAPAEGAPRIVAVADDGSEIIYEGDAAAGKQATLDDDPPPAPRPPPRPPAASASTTAGSARPAPAPSPPRARPARPQTRERDLPATTRSGADAGNDYRSAVELVKSGQHTEGAAALRAFIAKHRRHDFADNAQYWIGEAFYAQKDYPSALAEFRAVIDKYPRGNKVPDALLKVGYCYLALGQADKSRAVLEQVVNLYPKTEPAATAAKRLESL
jgi:tol-pal system protein YbgF